MGQIGERLRFFLRLAGSKAVELGQKSVEEIALCGGVHIVDAHWPSIAAGLAGIRALHELIAGHALSQVK